FFKVATFRFDDCFAHSWHSLDELQEALVPTTVSLCDAEKVNGWTLHAWFPPTMTPNTSRLCKGYLTKKESDGVLRQMTWPPQSPDLNPIEMVWGELDHRVKAKGPASAKHLWELLQDCWKTIPGDYLLKLIKRMPRECSSRECAKQASKQKDNSTICYFKCQVTKQRKNYARDSVSVVSETSQYHVEHLTTFVMDRKDAVLTIDDGIRKLKLLDAKGKVWTQDMYLQVDDKAVSLYDIETKTELENFPVGGIQHCKAVMNSCRYDSILALVCKEPTQSKADLHLFQCDEV
ncbi:unnamed protein product, partial [Ranitomeya imitator]